MERKIEDVVETLKATKVRQKKCTLLIGAGCSVKAGVPTAAGFVEAIKAKYPQAFGRASKKTYASCMAELAVSERRDLIADYVDKAKINWAHIGVAQLIKYGYVDRVLTTNFDLLVARACALVGLFPAVYDFATSQLYKPADITDEAIIHLHGQRTGFVLMNTEEECKRHSKLMKPIFQDAGLGRVWLVVGYSGNNDPVFDHLAKTSRFDNNLYWVGYLDNEPPLHVEERLLRPSKDAYFVRGYDADDFFVRISQELRIFPPDFAARPFSHLDSLLATVAPYKIPGEDANVDVTAEARRLIQTAINQHEQAPEDETPTVLKASRELLARNYDGVIAQLSKGSESSPELQSVLGWAYLLSGNALSGQAETKSGSEADDLFRLAGEKYGAALKIKPDKHEALNNWGNALSGQAKTKSGSEADRLFRLAGEKYEAALKIKPDSHKALYNWGNALSGQAETKSGSEADDLFRLAGEKYEAALKIKPDSHEALNNWGYGVSTSFR